MPLFPSQKIRFDEKEHKYFTKSGKELISASTLVHKFTPKFDEDGSISKRCAEKRGISQEQIKKEWEDLGKKAAENGTKFHAEAEHWAKKREVRDTEFSDVVGQLNAFPFKGSLHSEQRIGLPNWGIAGTIDLIDKFNSNECDLYDYKLVKELKKKSFFMYGKGYSMLLPPVSHLMNCNFVTYSLQLSIYAIMLEELGLWVRKKFLLHVNPENRKIEQHEILPLEKEAMALIRKVN